MATVIIRNHICKGVQNVNSGNIMTMWKTQFNMPVPDIFTTSPTYSLANWPFSFFSEASSFDFAGFEVGWEALFGVTCLEITWPTSAWAYVIIEQTWKNPLGGIQFDQWGYSFLSNAINLPVMTAGQKAGCFYLSNQGVESYEFGMNGTHTLGINVSGSVFGSLISSFTLSNVPNTTNIPLYSWYIWVEWENLCFISSLYDKHSIVGTNLWNIGTAGSGAFWVNGEDIEWVSASGNKYTSWFSLTTKEKRSMRQVASVFSWWATWSTFAGVSKVGYIWVDTEFWNQHIAYIWQSWYKNLLYSWNYPWVAP